MRIVYCLLLLLVHIHSDCDLNNEDLHECMVYKPRLLVQQLSISHTIRELIIPPPSPIHQFIHPTNLTRCHVYTLPTPQDCLKIVLPSAPLALLMVQSSTSSVKIVVNLRYLHVVLIPSKRIILIYIDVTA